MLSGREGVLEYIRGLGASEARRRLSRLSDRELLRRFSTDRDEGAFAVLVQRHGRMVFCACRRVLPNREDAEEAFQAAFLLLAKKAGSQGWQESVANWLYLVALRLAKQARAKAARRSGHECRAARAASCDPPAEVAEWELRTVCDEELARLPERYRLPIVLCCLEGLTRDEAAEQLGWPLGTLKRRLEQGRDRLRARLARRGFTLSAALFTPLLAQGAAGAVVPRALAESTVGAAAAFAAGRPAALLAVPPGTAALTKGALKAMFWTKVRSVLVVSLGACALAVGAARLSPVVGQDSPGKVEPRVGAAPGSPARLTAAPGAEEPAWKKEFDKAYALADGEVLRRVAPPYPASRTDFFKDATAGKTVSVGPGPAFPEEHFSAFRWKDGKVKIGQLKPGVKPDDGVTLRDVLGLACDIPAREVEGDGGLLGLKVTGDFVLREGADPAKVAARLQDILQKECKLEVKLGFKELEREVVVATGKFKLKPIDPKRKDRVELYAVELTDPKVGGGGSGTVPEFLGHLSAYVNSRVGMSGDTRIVNEAEFDSKAKVNWHSNVRIGPDGGVVDWDADHDPEAVLKNVADQTGLSFKTQKRKVRVLLVESK